MSYGESKIGTPWRGYYITAYGIAVKHGFKGTEEEWLESLVGKAVEIRYNDVTNVLEWSYAGEDVWTELLSLEDLQTEIVAQTLAQAEAAKQAAQNAQTAAEAAQSAAEAAQQEAEQNAGITQADASITQTNVQLTQEAKTAAEAAQQAAQNAQQAAEAAGTDAEESATLSKSWAVGGTGTRPGEDTNNAEYWARQAAIAAGGGVLTFNGRTGNVTPEQGDYTPDQVGAADQTLSNLTDYQKALFNIGGRPNKNLFYNAHFLGGGSQKGYGTFPINQSGSETYTQEGQGIDGWKLANAHTMTVKENGVELSPGGRANAIVQQKGLPAAEFAGKVVTVSVLVTENTTQYGYTFVVDTSTSAPTNKYAIIPAGETGLFSATFEAPQADTIIGFLRSSFGNAESGKITIQDVKLELGNKQTLAYKDSNGNWTPFEFPEFGKELARCQQYQLVLDNLARYRAISIDTNTVDFFIPTPVTMRAKPVLESFSATVFPVDSSSGVSGFSFAVIDKSSNGIYVRATKEGHGLTDARINITAGAILNASA